MLALAAAADLGAAHVGVLGVLAGAGMLLHAMRDRFLAARPIARGILGGRPVRGASFAYAVALELCVAGVGMLGSRALVGELLEAMRDRLGAFTRVIAVRGRVVGGRLISVRRVVAVRGRVVRSVAGRLIALRGVITVRGVIALRWLIVLAIRRLGRRVGVGLVFLRGRLGSVVCARGVGVLGLSVGRFVAVARRALVSCRVTIRMFRAAFAQRTAAVLRVRRMIPAG